MHTKYKKVPQ